MIAETKKKIEQVDKSLAWLRSHRPDHYGQRFLQLVECRKVLKRIASAEENNPGIAAFGKSQVGKSYLISCLLSDNGKPFMIRAGKEQFNFVFSINPPSGEGGKVESTGVVSRFSSYKRHPEAYNEDLPVLIKTFSVSDIITILSDSYFNDFTNYTTMSESEINSLCSVMQSRYSQNEEQRNPVITPDEILLMKDYFAKHLNNAQAINNSQFFNQLALLIQKIPVADYPGLFSHLWNEDADITSLFSVLYNVLAQLDFRRSIYLPIDAVLHDGIKENTIMSVQCLNKLLDGDVKYKTDVYVKEGDKYVKKISQVSKSAICAICSEVIFKIEENFLSSSGRYDLSHFGEDVAHRMNQQEINMSMLQDNDLLDFPGARTRLNLRLPFSNESKESKSILLLQAFLRGKVAYLFNKYNEELWINILLFCHHNKANDVTILYQLIEDWINNYVGETPEDRRRKISMTGVSPFFFIGTMFNLDMSLGVGEQISENAIHQRWNDRLGTVMNKEVFNKENVEWMYNWTRPGENFQNSYMLRDYKFSGPKSGLYSGFEEDHRETGMLMSEDYYQLMRKTFVENPFVKQYFADPALSWDVAASINNDGALYIMERLAEVASKMDKAREVQFAEMSQRVMDRVYKIMREYYVSDDTSEILEENIRKANGIFREMEFACQQHPEYFGHLLQGLQLTESECFKALHQLLPTLSATVYSSSAIRDYELIRQRCDHFEGCVSDEDKWKRFIATYHLRDKEEAASFLRTKKVDAQKLFQGETLKRKNSAVITNALMGLWKDNITGVQFMDAFSGEGEMDGIMLSNLVTCLLDSADSLQLSEMIERQIADYVDILNISTINEDLVADIVATAISDFVINFGYGYLTEDQLKTSRKVSQEQHLSCFNWTGKERNEHYEEEELTHLFNDILSSSGRYTPAYVANYNSWLEYMYIAFVAHIDVPEFDRVANDELKDLLAVLK